MLHCRLACRAFEIESSGPREHFRLFEFGAVLFTPLAAASSFSVLRPNFRQSELHLCESTNCFTPSVPLFQVAIGTV